MKNGEFEEPLSDLYSRIAITERSESMAVAENQFEIDAENHY